MLVRPARGRPGGVYWYVLQTYDAARIAFNRYKRLAEKIPGFLIRKPNESDLTCTLFNGACVHFKSGKNYEDLRAETLDGAIIDEVRQQYPQLWPMIIRPMLARRGGWCYFFSTPNGFDHFKDLWDFAVLNPHEWEIFHAPSTEAWWWSPEEVASARATMSEAEFAQEILAEFREIGKGKVYLSHGTWNQTTQNPFAQAGQLWSPYLPIILGCDFNVGLMCWELGQRKGRGFFYGDEIAVENTNTEQCAQILVEKVKHHLAGIEIIGDASGKANRTSASGETDYSIITKALKAAKIKYRNLTPESNPAIKDRVNIMNSMMKSASGEVNFWYHPFKCKQLKLDLERMTWKEGAMGAIFDKSDPKRSHSSDAAGYPVCYYSDEFRPKPGQLRVLVR